MGANKPQVVAWVTPVGMLCFAKDGPPYGDALADGWKPLVLEDPFLQQELDAASKDAKRYQWFRTHENWRDSGPFDSLYEHELDEAVDAAISVDIPDNAIRE